MELRWCRVCGTFVSREDHEQDPRYEAFHGGEDRDWHDALVAVPT